MYFEGTGRVLCRGRLVGEGELVTTNDMGERSGFLV